MTDIDIKTVKKFEITIYYNSDNSQEGTISEYMQSDLKAIGVKLNIVGEEKQSFLDRQKVVTSIYNTLYLGVHHMTLNLTYLLGEYQHMVTTKLK